jgi:hypothetical protein
MQYMGVDECWKFCVAKIHQIQRFKKKLHKSCMVPLSYIRFTVCGKREHGCTGACVGKEGFFFGGGGLGRSISGLILHQNRIWCSASMAWVLGIGSSRGADSSVHTGTLVFKLFVKIILFCGVAMYCGRKWPGTSVWNMEAALSCKML